MGKAHSRLYFHLVFSTKHREPKIKYSFEKELHSFLGKKLEELDCSPIAINGTSDHVHILFRGKREVSISNVVKHIKGTSSFWVNQNEFIDEQFAWQRGYSVFSVSDFHLKVVFQYIQNQKTHHRDGVDLNPYLEGKKSSVGFKPYAA